MLSVEQNGRGSYTFGFATAKPTVRVVLIEINASATQMRVERLGRVSLCFSVPQQRRCAALQFFVKQSVFVAISVYRLDSALLKVCLCVSFWIEFYHVYAIA